MKENQIKGWLYLLPALLFLGFFLVYPLIDVFIYSFEEGYNFASQTYYGVGLYNFSYVLHDPLFSSGGAEHLPAGHHHRSDFHGSCAC